MPSGVSDYGSSRWLSALFGVVPLPSSYYVALTAYQPGAAMDGNMVASIEPTDIAYRRQLYGTGPEAWAANGAYLTNTDPVAFPTPGQDWGYLTHFALCTALTGGQLYAWGELFNPQYATRDIGLTIPAGALVLGLHALDNSIAA